MKIGVNIHVFNANLRKARRKHGMTQKDLAVAVGVSVAKIQAIEQMRYPGSDFTFVRELLLTIADILDEEYNLLFPPDYLFALQENYFPKQRKLSFYQDIDILSLPQSSSLGLPESILETQEMENAIQATLKQLHRREREILMYRFGFGCDRHTLQEAADKFSISRERIRQMEAIALRRLRNPRNRKILDEWRPV